MAAVPKTVLKQFTIFQNSFRVKNILHQLN